VCDAAKSNPQHFWDQRTADRIFIRRREGGRTSSPSSDNFHSEKNREVSKYKFVNAHNG